MFTLRRSASRAVALILIATAAAAATVALDGQGPTRAPAPAATANHAPAPVTLVAADLEAGHAHRAAARKAHRAAKGYTYYDNRLLGYTPAGLNVWVNRSTKHHTAIAKYTKAGVAELRRAGVPIVYRGWGTPTRTEGVVTVSEGRRGCAKDGRVGTTYPLMGMLSGNRAYVYNAEIAICPTLFKYARWQWVATMKHELGHAVGLGHSGKYHGKAQLMHWRNTPGVTTFRAGDKAGVRALARNTSAVRVALSQ